MRPWRARHWRLLGACTRPGCSSLNAPNLTLVTDHRPLVGLLGDKALTDISNPETLPPEGENTELSIHHLLLTWQEELCCRSFVKIPSTQSAAGHERGGPGYGHTGGNRGSGDSRAGCVPVPHPGLGRGHAGCAWQTSYSSPKWVTATGAAAGRRRSAACAPTTT